WRCCSCWVSSLAAGRAPPAALSGLPGFTPSTLATPALSGYKGEGRISPAQASQPRSAAILSSLLITSIVMPFVITCPSCGLQGHIPDGFNAPGAECPRCKTYVPVSLDETLRVHDTVAARSGDGDANPLDAFFARVATPPAPVDMASALAKASAT